ncbi:MAG: 16S rRNA (cytidine(1402)-2'-O)-methyltransferase [Alphaproteobacteria bacterium]|nr:16S rRNA (cytidine(1402)-2'-O)-methyltransferase [Alphaproteobacteria bacterium]
MRSRVAKPKPTGASGPSKSRDDDAPPSLLPGLYVTATPIGNLSDLTDRAKDVLSRCDHILAEDTRVTAKLLARHGIRTKLRAYHEHVAGKEGPRALEAIRAGAAIALVSDAGTPLISDPGERLVAEVAAAGLPIVCIPGPSSLVAALSVAGLSTRRVLFGGFLPPKAAARRAELRELAAIPASLVFFEGPSRLGDALDDLLDILGPRRAVVARELTKLHEEVVRGDLGELAARYAGAVVRGECVIVIAPPGEEAARDEGDLEMALGEALGHLSLKEAVASVTAKTGLPRREVYARALALTRDRA